MTRAVRDRILKDVNGNIHDHIRNHIHLTNCIHLKNHMHMKHSPIIADRALMRDLIFLQRSKSLRDPSASPHSSKMGGKNEPVTGSRRSSGDRNPRMSETSPRRVSKDKSFETEDESNHAALSCSNNHKNRAQVEKYPEEVSRNNINRPKRRRFRGSRRPRAAPSVDKRDISGGAHNEISVASNSFAHGENRDNDKFYLQNGCGKIPWNWSRIHDRGKSILDMAGRSISCGGMSEPRLRKEHGSNMLEISQNSSSSSTRKSDGQEALPLLLDGSQGSGGDRGAATWLRDYSGELGLYADNLLDKNEIDSDHKKYNNGRHQNITQKYTPRTFRDLVGQNLVVQALSNAIIKRKIGLMYLFHGPHGTGKTSCARIFARALNCHSLEHPKPCGLCSSCARDRNVREIGPVSNVDFERLVDLLDKMVGPTRSQSQSRSQYKVLIFDECDTLSSECWSAVLKATDRAPRRVVFVLVCSSFEALPHVIISRCQKFYFPKLKDADVIYTLQWIASKEDLEIDKDALKLIASRSDGSLRDAEMTLEQLSLLGKRISLGLVQELVGLISDEKLVDLLDLALSADTVNTVKNLRDIMESGVEPLALMSQLATVITDILAGSYDFAKEGSRRKFFRRNALSKEDMEKLRQALKTLSEAEKQLRLSNDRITWLTAALLQLAPDQQYILPSSSADTSYHHSPSRKPRKSNAEMSKGTTISGNRHDRSRGVTNDQLPGVFRKEEIEEIWLQVLEKIPINTVREFMYREGKLISVSYDAAPTVQLLFTSQLTKSKAEKFRLHVLQAFESVLKSPVAIEIRCEPKTGPSSRPILLPGAQNPTTHLDVGPSRTEIVELEASPPNQEIITRERRGSMVNSRSGEGTSPSQKISSLLGEGNAPSLSIVRRKMSLAHVIQHAEAGGGSQQQLGGWSRRKAVSIAEKLEQENLRLEPRSRRLLCWNPPKATRRKLSRLKIRTRKPQALMKYVSCGKCLSGGSPRTR